MLSTRALREYVARGAATKGGPSARAATVLKPGRYVDKILPDSEHWFAVDLARGETLKASVSFIAPERGIEDYGTDSSLDIVTPDFDIPGYQNSSAVAATPFDRRGYVSALGAVSRPIGVGEQAEEGAAVLQARPLLPQGRASRTRARRRCTTSPAASRTTPELAVEVLGRSGKAAGRRSPSRR